MYGMHIFKNKLFHQWALKLKIADSALVDMISDLEKGLHDANLGGYVYKKRISIGSRGKGGGARTIIAFKARGKAFFIYGFSKNEKDNITEKEKEALKALAKLYFSYNDKQIQHAIKNGELIEVKL
jgi:hypothetical protein